MRPVLAALMLGLAVLPAAAAAADPPRAGGPVSKPTLVARYGTAPMQFGQLRVPKGKGPFPVVIFYHGGCLLRQMANVEGSADVATALTARGIATWNVEYRALGDEGAGYPGTYQDWGAAADHLRVLAKTYPLDLKRVVAVGHSAGAPAAVFAATRVRMKPGAASRGKAPLPVSAVVAIDGPPDPANLAGLDERVCGQPIVKRFLGGTSAERPAVYSEISPVTHRPLGVPVYMVSSSPVLPMALAEAYRRDSAAVGDRVEVTAVKGDHFNVVTPGQPQWTETEAVILKALGMR